MLPTLGSLELAELLYWFLHARSLTKPTSLLPWSSHVVRTNIMNEQALLKPETPKNLDTDHKNTTLSKRRNPPGAESVAPELRRKQAEKDPAGPVQPRRRSVIRFTKTQDRNGEKSASPDTRPSPRIVRAFGTSDTKAVMQFLHQIEFALPGGRDAARCNIDYAVSTLEGINPKDQLEGLLALQIMTTHTLAMEFMRRAMGENQTVEGVDRNMNRLTKLLATFVAQVEALNRHRGKGEQKVIVKHVHVHEGGQAIVGAVSQSRPGGGGSDDQS